MDVTISIPDPVAAKLSERASANGEALPAYTSKLVQQVVQGPTLEELLAPIQADFAQTGMTQDELLDLSRSLLEKVRNQQKD